MDDLSIPIHKQEWCDEHEDLLKEWAEKGRYYSWMHHKTSVDYGRLNNLLTLPMILISTVSGSANFSMMGQNSDTFVLSTILPFVIGTMGLTSAILSSLTRFLKTAELAEKHAMFYRQFNILVRSICLELSLPRIQRKKPFEILNLNRHEFDRLVNGAPAIPEHIVAEFNKRFPLNNNKPEIANAFDKIRIYGRGGKELKSREILFKKLRHFYKWKINAINKAEHRMSFISNIKTSDDDDGYKYDGYNDDGYDDDDDDSEKDTTNTNDDIEMGKRKQNRAISFNRNLKKIVPIDEK
jgi:hypothetical protein